MVQAIYQEKLWSGLGGWWGRPDDQNKAVVRETLKILKIDSGGIFNNLNDATSNIIRLLSDRCVLESLTVRSRMNPDFGEKILKLAKNTNLRLVDLTQIVLIKIIQERFCNFLKYFRFDPLFPVWRFTSGWEIEQGYGFKLEDQRRWRHRNGSFEEKLSKRTSRNSMFFYKSRIFHCVKFKKFSLKIENDEINKVY